MVIFQITYNGLDYRVWIHNSSKERVGEPYWHPLTGKNGLPHLWRKDKIFYGYKGRYETEEEALGVIKEISEQLRQLSNPSKVVYRIDENGKIYDSDPADFGRRNPHGVNERSISQKVGVNKYVGGCNG